MLHTWSLAVEWQFYLVLPVVLSILWKLRPGKSTVLLITAIGLFASLALVIVITPLKPSSAFFLLPTRAWEMLAGGGVYLLPNQFSVSKFQKKVMELIGLITIAACINVFDASTVWPGWRATLPVLGSMLVLFAAVDRSPMTGNRVAQWLGTRSYSLYLWHWPITVGLRYMDQFNQPAAVAIGLFLTLLLGDASYRLVEMRSSQYLNKQTMMRGFFTLVAGVSVIVAISGSIFLNKGFSGRFRQEIDIISQEQFNKNSRREMCHTESGTKSVSCIYGGNNLGVILIGDSHADAVVTALAKAVPQPYGVMQWSYSACPILLGAHRENIDKKNGCGGFVDWVMQELDKFPHDVPVVIVNRHGQYVFGKNEEPAQANIPWVSFSRPYIRSEPIFIKEYAQHITDVACKIAKKRKVYLVRPIPEMGFNVPNMARAMVWGINKEVAVTVSDYHLRNDFAWAAQDVAQQECGVQILDPLPYLCWDGICHGSKDGRPLYFDDNHLSEFGNKLLVPMFEKVIFGNATSAVATTGVSK